MQIEKELLAITFSCKKFHNYIYGYGEVTIYTDHMPLTSIINKTLDEIQNNRIKRLKEGHTVRNSLLLMILKYRQYHGMTIKW